MAGYINEEIEEILDGLDEFAIVQIWNEYARDNEQPSIYLMEDIEDILEGEYEFSLIQIIDNLDGAFDTNDEYFSVDIYGDENIRSFTDFYSSNSPFDIQALIDNIAETEQGYGNPELEALFQ